MFSGLLFSLTTIEKIFFIDVVTAAIAVLILMFFLRVPSPVKSHNLAEVSYFKDLHEGIVYIKNHAYVKKFFLFCAFFIFLAAPASFLTPLQVARSFGEEVWRLTAIEIAFSSGMILGGLIMASWGGLKNRIHTMTLSCFIFGVCTFLLGLIPVFSLYLLVMLICGIFMPFFNTPATVLLQEKVEPDLLGRVFSVLSMISSSMMPLGMLVFGPLADLVRIELLLVGTGFLLCIQSFFLIGSKELVEAGKPSAG
jgi:DHA3 family macrolide efflux protein-like MFS transporter